MGPVVVGRPTISERPISPHIVGAKILVCNFSTSFSELCNYFFANVNVLYSRCKPEYLKCYRVFYRLSKAATSIVKPSNLVSLPNKDVFYKDS